MMNFSEDEESSSEMDEHFGSMRQLENFWHKYRDHDTKSRKCFLDGRYFWKVLDPFQGLVPEELVVNVHHHNRRDSNIQIIFDPEAIELSEGPIRLIKVIISGTTERNENLGTIHPNLIFIDIENEEVVRFEPLYDEEFTDQINEKLREYFADVLPDFHYRMLNCHPQISDNEECPARGMASAYVLKMAMVLATESMECEVEDVCPFVHDAEEEEERIMAFVDAIEMEYGEFLGDVEREYGIFDKFKESKYNPKNIAQKAGEKIGVVTTGDKDRILQFIVSIHNKVFGVDDLFKAPLDIGPWNDLINKVQTFVKNNAQGDSKLMSALNEIMRENSNLINSIKKTYDDLKNNKITPIQQGSRQGLFRELSSKINTTEKQLNQLSLTLPSKKDAREILGKFATFIAVTADAARSHLSKRDLKPKQVELRKSFVIQPTKSPQKRQKQAVAVPPKSKGVPIARVGKSGHVPEAKTPEISAE